MQLKHVRFVAAALGALAAPVAAQNSAEPPVVAPPPPAKVETPPPSSSTPPPSSEPSPPPTVVTPAPVIVSPPVQTAPLEPVTINPDAAYPNGFADPMDPNATNLELGYREQRRGFDWGLLGLLGLFGLIPLFRRERYGRSVYVERDDVPPRRVVRTERIDEE